jgi:hypothetical protein
MTELYEIPHSMNLYCASCAFFFSTQMKKAAQQVWQLHHGTVTHTGLRYEDGTVIQKGVTQEREVGAAGGWTSDGRMEGTAAVHREKNKEAL